MIAVQEYNDFEGFPKDMHETTRKIRIKCLKIQQDVAAEEFEQLSSDNSEDEEKSDLYDASMMEDEKENYVHNCLTEDTTVENGNKHYKKDENNSDDYLENKSVTTDVSLSNKNYRRIKDMIKSHLASCMSEDVTENAEEKIYWLNSDDNQSNQVTLQVYHNGSKYCKPLQKKFKGSTHEEQKCSTPNTEPVAQDIFQQEHLLPNVIQPQQEFEGFTYQDRNYFRNLKTEYIRVREELGMIHNVNLTQAWKRKINFQEKLTKQDRRQLWEVKERQYYILSQSFVNDHMEWLRMSQAWLRQTQYLSFSGCPKSFAQYQDLVELEVAVNRVLIYGSPRHQQLTTRDLYTSLHPVVRNKISELKMQRLLLMSPLYCSDISKSMWQRTSEVLKRDPKFPQHHMIQWLGVLDLRKAWAWTGRDLWIWAEEVRTECVNSMLCEGITLSLDEVSKDISKCIFIPESQELLHLAHFTLCYARKFQKSHDQISDLDFSKTVKNCHNLKLRHPPTKKNASKVFQNWMLHVAQYAGEKNIIASIKNKKSPNSMKDEDVLERFIDKCPNSEEDNVGGSKGIALIGKPSYSDEKEVVNDVSYTNPISHFMLGKRNPTEKTATKLPSQLNTKVHNFIDAKPMRNKEMVTYSINTTDMVDFGTGIDKLSALKWKNKSNQPWTGSDLDQGQIQQCTQFGSTASQTTSTYSTQSSSQQSSNTLTTLFYSAKCNDDSTQSIRVTESVFANLNERTPPSKQPPFVLKPSQVSDLRVVNTISSSGTADCHKGTLHVKQLLTVAKTNQGPILSVMNSESSVSHLIEPMGSTRKESATCGVGQNLKTQNSNNITQLLSSHCKKQSTPRPCKKLQSMEKVPILKASRIKTPIPIIPNTSVIPVLNTHQIYQSSCKLHHVVSMNKVPRLRIKTVSELAQVNPTEEPSDDSTSIEMENTNHNSTIHSPIGFLGERESVHGSYVLPCMFQTQKGLLKQPKVCPSSSKVTNQNWNTSTTNNIPVRGILKSEPKMETKGSQSASVTSLPACVFNNKNNQINLCGMENLKKTAALIFLKDEVIDHSEMKANTEEPVRFVTDQDGAKSSTYSDQLDHQLLDVPTTILNHEQIESVTKEFTPKQLTRFDSQNPAHQEPAKKGKMGIVKNLDKARCFAEKKYFNKRKQCSPVINSSCETRKTYQLGEKQQGLTNVAKTVDTGTNICDIKKMSISPVSGAKYSHCVKALGNKTKTHPTVERVSSPICENQTMYSHREVDATEDAGLEGCIRIGEVVSIAERSFTDEKNALLIPTTHHREQILPNILRTLQHDETRELIPTNEWMIDPSVSTNFNLSSGIPTAVHPPSLPSTFAAASMLTAVSTTLSLATSTSKPIFIAPQVATSSCQPALPITGELLVTASPYINTALNQPTLLYNNISTTTYQSSNKCISTPSGPQSTSILTSLSTIPVESNLFGQPTAPSIYNLTDLPYTSLSSSPSVSKCNGLLVAPLPASNIPPRLPTVLNASTPFDNTLPQAVFIPAVLLTSSTDYTPTIHMGPFTSRTDTSNDKSPDPNIKSQLKYTLSNTKYHDGKQDCRYKGALEIDHAPPNTIYTPAGSPLHTSVSVAIDPSSAPKMYAPAGLPSVPKLQTTTAFRVTEPVGKLPVPRINTLVDPSSATTVNMSSGSSLVLRLPVAADLTSAPEVTIPAGSTSSRFYLRAVSPMTSPSVLSSATQLHTLPPLSSFPITSPVASSVSGLTESLSVPRVSRAAGLSSAPSVTNITDSTSPRVAKLFGSSSDSKVFGQAGPSAPRVTTYAGLLSAPSLTTPAGPPSAPRLTTFAGPSFGPRLTTPTGPSSTPRLTTPTGPSFGPRLTTPTGPSSTPRLTTPTGPSSTPRLTTPTGPSSTPRLTTPTGPSSTPRLTTPTGPSSTPRLTTPTGPSSTPRLTTPTGPSSTPRLTTPTGPSSTPRLTTPTGPSSTPRLTTPTGPSSTPRLTTPTGPSSTPRLTTPTGPSSTPRLTTPTGPSSTPRLTTPTGPSVASRLTISTSPLSSPRLITPASPSLAPRLTTYNGLSSTLGLPMATGPSLIPRVTSVGSNIYASCPLSAPGVSSCIVSPSSCINTRESSQLISSTAYAPPSIIGTPLISTFDCPTTASTSSNMSSLQTAKVISPPADLLRGSEIRTSTNFLTPVSSCLTVPANLSNSSKWRHTRKNLSKNVTLKSVDGSDALRSTDSFQQCPSIRIVENHEHTCVCTFIHGIPEEVKLEVKEIDGQHSFSQRAQHEKYKDAESSEKDFLFTKNNNSSKSTGVKRKRKSCNDENSSNNKVLDAKNLCADHTYAKVMVLANNYSKAKTEVSYRKRRSTLTTGAAASQFTRCNLQCCATPSAKWKIERLDEDQNLRPYMSKMKRIRGINYKDPEVLKKYKIPLTLGWQREVVQRATICFNVRCDVYYHSPFGKKLRSTVEVENYLVENGVTDVGTDNFTFWREPLGYGEPYEIYRQAQRRSRVTQDGSPMQDRLPTQSKHSNSEVQQRTYVRRVPQWKKIKNAPRPDVNQPPREWPNDGFWVTDFNDVHNNMGTDDVEIVNEAGELTGFEEWREESESQNQEQLHGPKIEIERANQCMERVQLQQPEELKQNSEEAKDLVAKQCRGETNTTVRKM
ncbi:hypothetical protein Pmani_021131 [Petrolisthes manimaculis]|uniref:MBD domain-containing protein n=1 Tax=Petrolisthes manimaculis TaxID=1843537 RepID=A0AAE1PG81_9EUCA|nr:hypothetical protein Pmani_021131 [Petrolisthes manimaculis]